MKTPSKKKYNQGFPLGTWDEITSVIGRAVGRAAGLVGACRVAEEEATLAAARALCVATASRGTRPLDAHLRSCVLVLLPLEKDDSL